MIRTITPRYNELISLFSKSIEPYRFQGNLCIYVSYTDFSKFMKNLSISGVTLTKYSIVIYQKIFRSEKVALADEILRKCFLIEVAQCLLTEVTLAREYNRRATIILPEFSEGDYSDIVVERLHDISCKNYTFEISMQSNRDTTVSIDTHNKVLQDISATLESIGNTGDFNKYQNIRF